MIDWQTAIRKKCNLVRCRRVTENRQDILRSMLIRRVILVDNEAPKASARGGCAMHLAASLLALEKARRLVAGVHSSVFVAGRKESVDRSHDR